MKPIDRLAFIMAIAAFFAALWFSVDVYEGVPHIEDEITYVWQARLAAQGRLVTASPVCPSCFLEPFVIDQDGIRFGKYPPGWPAALSLGIRLGLRDYVNPFLSALYVWLAYLLVKKLLDPLTGLIATFLTITSPFFLMNSGSLLAHPWSLLLVVTFAHGWIDALDPNNTIPRGMTAATALLSMALLVLTRPLTALGVGIPFIIHGIILLVKGTPRQKRLVLIIGALTALVSSLYLLWQYRVTGNPLLNPYVLYWPYDRVGFGPEVGLNVGGHQLKYAIVNTRFSLRVGAADLFGWPFLSWLFLPFGLIALLKKPETWPAAGVFFTLVLAYGLYWIGAWVFGPRYYYEGLFSLTLLSAAGITWLAGLPRKSKAPGFFAHARFVTTAVIVLILAAGNLAFYLPLRAESMRGLYGINAGRIEPFHSQTARNLAPALVIVSASGYWLEYGALLDISSPFLDTPFIFTLDRGAELNQTVINAYPERRVIYYNTAEPYTFVIPQ